MDSRQFPWMLILVMAIAALGACGETDPSRATTVDRVSKVPSTSTTQSNMGVSFNGEAERAKAELEGADEIQLQMIEDGQITYEEYETAMLTFFECVRAEGLDVVELGVVDAPRGFPMLDYAIAVEGQGIAEAAGVELVERCAVTHAASVDTAWQLGHDPFNDKDAMEEAIGLLGKCLNTHGVPTGNLTIDNYAEGFRAAIQLIDDGGADCLLESGLSTE